MINRVGPAAAARHAIIVRTAGSEQVARARVQRFRPESNGYIISATSEVDVSKSLQEWLADGEALYEATVKEYQELEAQLDELEVRLAAKKSEVNQIAQVVGKPTIEGPKRLVAQLVEETGPNSVPNSPATIARAIRGRLAR
jgi:hypothetical protein